MTIRVRRFRTRTGEALGPLERPLDRSIATEPVAMQTSLSSEGTEMGLVAVTEEDKRIAAMHPPVMGWRSA